MNNSIDFAAKSDSFNSIAVKKIKLAYGTKLIIPEVDLNIDKPEIISIIGPNGSGKSTLLRGISRLLKPKAGCVLLNGNDIFKMPTKAVARTMAILPQIVHAPGDMTVEDLVTCGRSPHRATFANLNENDRFYIDEAIKLTRMENFSCRRLDSLSGGERQRAWLAMALAQKPKILLLDEPTSYLDIRHQLELMNLITQLYEKLKLTVVMVLHDLNQAVRYSNRIIAMKDGTVYADGRVSEIFNAELLKSLYGVEAAIINIEQNGRTHPVCFPYDICGNKDAGI